MAEQPQPVEFVEVHTRDIEADRRMGWHAFNKAATYAIGVVAAVLVLMFIFLV